VVIILATTWFELETTGGANPLASNTYHCATYLLFIHQEDEELGFG